MNKRIEKKIVITGAGGFLGSNLVEALSGKDGYLVYALSSRGAYLQQMNEKGNIQYFQRDDIFSDDKDQILRDAIIVNCAFPRNTSGTEMAEGLRYIQRLFYKSVESSAKALINISSQSVYSQEREGAATEETPLYLGDQYAVGKYATELLLEMACKGNGISYTNLRMASLIGPGFDQRIVNRLIKQSIAGVELHVVRSNKKFGFMDVKDAVKALVLLLSVDPTKWKPFYNVGNGKEYGIEYIAECIQEVFKENGLSVPVVKFKNGDGSGVTAVAYHQFQEDTGFEPAVDLKTSIQLILDQLQR